MISLAWQPGPVGDGLGMHACERDRGGNFMATFFPQTADGHARFFVQN